MELLIIIIIFISAFVCSYVDCTFGMGYGTLMSPILLILGYPLSVIVPLLLLSQLCVGGASCIFHHVLKNANFHPKQKDTRIALIFTGFGSFAVLIAVFVVVIIPNIFLTIYVSLMIITIGIMLLAKISFTISKKNLYWIGGISAFNKAISGGGFGPILTSGQMMTGTEVKNAVAITTLSETFLSAFGFVLYCILIGFPDFFLAFIIIIGGLLASPLGVIQTKKIKEEKAKFIIGIIIISLGILTLLKCFF